MSFPRDGLRKFDGDEPIQPGRAYLVSTGGHSIWIGIACNKDVEKKSGSQFVSSVNSKSTEERLLFFLPARNDSL